MMYQPITPKPTISAPPMMNSMLRPVVAVVGRGDLRRSAVGVGLGRRQRAEGSALGARRSGDGEDEQGGEEGDPTRHGPGQGSHAGAPVNAHLDEAKRPPHVTSRTAISATSPHHTPVDAPATVAA